MSHDPQWLSSFFLHVDFFLPLAESIQFSIGPGISKDQLDEKHGIAIESVKVE